jgi:CheY-like chemotaxis protein
VVSSLTGAAVRKGVEIKVDIPDDLYFYADPKLIDRVIGNLLSNAIKFTPENKKIYISANKYGKDKIEVIVRDEGVGINEKEQHKIFKLDEKISTEGTAGEKGTGLGLALVKEIVEKHEGEIWFFSEEGKGSEFHFTIPEAKQIFLIIDDDVRALELFKKHIKNLFGDVEVLEAENGYEALNIAYKKIPSMIITDHDMPLMNGIQFIEVIKKNPKLKNVPIVVVSGALDSESYAAYKKLGVSEIIEKPFESERLVSTLQMLN